MMHLLLGDTSLGPRAPELHGDAGCEQQEGARQER